MTTTVWNTRKSPCMGCPDRYPGCSDHCKKETFLAWKAEKEKIKANRKAYTSPIWKREERDPWRY